MKNNNPVFKTVKDGKTFLVQKQINGGALFIDVDEKDEEQKKIIDRTTKENYEQNGLTDILKYLRKKKADRTGLNDREGEE